MRRATLEAAIRRGCVWPIIRSVPRPIARQIFGSCVVLPEPVSPQTITTGLSRIAWPISSRRAQTGSSSGKRIGNGGCARVFRNWISQINDLQGREVYFPLPMDDHIAPPSPATIGLSHAQFVAWLRQVAPYVHSHRGRTFVVAFEGELIEAGRLNALVHDLSL